MEQEHNVNANSFRLNQPDFQLFAGLTLLVILAMVAKKQQETVRVPV